MTLDLEDIQKMGLKSGNINAEASVYEPLSGKTLSGSGTTIIAASDYLVTFMDINNKYYRLDQDYTCYVSCYIIRLFTSCGLYNIVML